MWEHRNKKTGKKKDMPDLFKLTWKLESFANKFTKYDARATSELDNKSITRIDNNPKYNNINLVVKYLANKAHIKKVRTYLINSKQVEVTSSGFGEYDYIGISRGALKKMSSGELIANIAYQISDMATSDPLGDTMCYGLDILFDCMLGIIPSKLIEALGFAFIAFFLQDFFGSILLLDLLFIVIMIPIATHYHKDILTSRGKQTDKLAYKLLGDSGLKYLIKILEHKKSVKTTNYFEMKKDHKQHLLTGPTKSDIKENKKERTALAHRILKLDKDYLTKKVDQDN